MSVRPLSEWYEISIGATAACAAELQRVGCPQEIIAQALLHASSEVTKQRHVAQKEDRK